MDSTLMQGRDEVHETDKLSTIKELRLWNYLNNNQGYCNSDTSLSQLKTRIKPNQSEQKWEETTLPRSALGLIFTFTPVSIPFYVFYSILLCLCVGFFLSQTLYFSTSHCFSLGSFFLFFYHLPESMGGLGRFIHGEPPTGMDDLRLTEPDNESPLLWSLIMKEGGCIAESLTCLDSRPSVTPTHRTRRDSTKGESFDLHLCPLILGL